jgi:tyrosine-protein kinase
VEWQGYLSIFRARWRLVVLVPLLSGLAALAYCLTVTPIYTARSSVYLSVSVGTTAGELGRSFQYAQGLSRSYAEVGAEPLVLDRVAPRLSFPTTTQALEQQVTVQAPIDATALDVTVQDPSPARAAEIANEVARELTRPDLLGTQESGRLPVQVSVLQQAVPPAQPSSPHTRLTIAIAVVVGLLLGLVLAVARDAVDGRIRGPREARRVTGVPVIGSVAATGGAHRRWRPWGRRRRGAAEPELRVDSRLRMNFQHLRRVHAARSVVFTSGLVDGATSATVSQLATGLGRLGLDVVVVDADVRHPSVAQRHGVEGRTGLTDVLLGQVPAGDAVVRSPRDPVWVLPSGSAPSDPSQLLAPAALRRLLDELTESFDVVLVKAPPVLTAATGLVVATVSDGVVVVTDEAAMKRDVLTEELRMFDVAGSPVLGMIAHA